MTKREKAIEYFKKALALKPVDSDIAYYIACLYGEDDKLDDAKFYLEKAITFNKNNTQAIEYYKSIQETERANKLNAAISLYEEQKYDESLQQFNEILSADKLLRDFEWGGFYYDEG